MRKNCRCTARNRVGNGYLLIRPCEGQAKPKFQKFLPATVFARDLLLDSADRLTTTWSEQLRWNLVTSCVQDQRLSLSQARKLVAVHHNRDDYRDGAIPSTVMVGEMGARPVGHNLDTRQIYVQNGGPVDGDINPVSGIVTMVALVTRGISEIISLDSSGLMNQQFRVVLVLLLVMLSAGAISRAPGHARVFGKLSYKGEPAVPLLMFHIDGKPQCADLVVPVSNRQG